MLTVRHSAGQMLQSSQPRSSRVLCLSLAFDWTAVPLQVPLLWTAYAQVSFRDFSPLKTPSPAGEPAFYVVPAHYSPRTLEEVAASRNARAFQRSGSELSSEEAQLRRQQQQEMRRLWGHEEDS